MNLYQFNQLGYHSLPGLNKEDLESALPMISSYIARHLGGKYYMLLNNELRYYTLFTWKDNSSTPKDMAKEVIEIAKELGQIKIIDENEHDAIEIWVSDEETCHMYVLFNYDKGVIAV